MTAMNPGRARETDPTAGGAASAASAAGVAGVPEPMRLTARSPEDLIALAQILLGFTPERSLVMLTFGAQQPFHARIDLPDPDADDAAVAELVELLREPAVRHRVTRVVLLLYTDDDALARRCLDRAAAAFAGAGIDVADLLQVDADRWRSLLAQPARLRQAPWTRSDPSTHPFLARAVLQGRVILGSRAELAATLHPDPASVAAVESELARLEPWGVGLGPETRTRAELLAEGEWIEGLDPAILPAAADCARLLRATRLLVLRDAALGGIDRSSAPRHVEFWRAVLRSAPAQYKAAPATLLGWAAWQAGHGALAWCALDVAVECRPDYVLAGLLGEVLDRAIAPGAWTTRWDWRADL